MTDGTATPVGPDRIAAVERQLAEQITRAERTGEHVWVVAVAYRLSADAAHRIAHGSNDPALLDGENLLSLAPGCYVCEQPLTRRELGRRCRGEAATDAAHHRADT